MGSRLRTAVVFILIPGVVGIGMWFLGTAYGDRRTEEVRQHRRADLEEYQAVHLRDLGVGTNLASLLVSGRDGVAVRLGEVLPAGGLIVYVSAGCEACFGTAEVVSDAVDQNSQMDAILLVRGDPSELRKFCEGKGSRIPVFQDSEDALALRHRVAVYPSHLVVDRDCHVLTVGAGLSQEADYARILAQGRTRP